DRRAGGGVRRRVAVTGAGVISALGGTAQETWRGLVEGRTGIGPLTLFDSSRDRTHTAAQITSTAWDEGVSSRERARLCGGDRLALHAARQALDDAGLAPRDVAGPRAGIVLGGGGSGLLQAEAYLEATLRGGRPRPSTALGFFMGTTVSVLAQRLGVEGRV